MPKSDVTEEQLLSASGGLSGVASTMKLPKKASHFAFTSTAADLDAARGGRGENNAVDEVISNTEELPIPLPSRNTTRNDATAHKTASKDVSTGKKKGWANYEKVSVPVASEDRDTLEGLAKILQRQRTTRVAHKGFTGPVLMRLGIKLLAEKIKIGPNDAVGSEEELYELLKSKLNLR